MPDFTKNIISVVRLIQKGAKVSMIKSEMIVDIGSGNTIKCARDKSTGLYYFHGIRIREDSANNIEETAKTGKKRTPSMPKTMDINEAHDVYGHACNSALRMTFQDLPCKLTGSMESCDGCARAKAQAKRVGKVATNPATKSGERLCLDTSGPFNKTINGSRYWIKLVDEYSTKSWDKFAKAKSDVPKFAEETITEILAKNVQVQYLRCDNAGEHLTTLVEFCKKKGIKMEYTAPNTPQQNGVVERRFVTDQGRGLAMMFAANLTPEYHKLLWAEAMSCASNIGNILANSRTKKAPITVWDGSTPSLYPHMVQWGRVGYVTIRSKFRKKMTSKSYKGVMMGYAANHSGDTYRMFKPETKTIVMSRDVRWAKWEKPDPKNGMDLFKDILNPEEWKNGIGEDTPETPNNNDGENSNSDKTDEQNNDDDEEVEPREIPRVRDMPALIEDSDDEDAPNATAGRMVGRVDEPAITPRQTQDATTRAVRFVDKKDKKTARTEAEESAAKRAAKLASATEKIEHKLQPSVKAYNGADYAHQKRRRRGYKRSELCV